MQRFFLSLSLFFALGLVHAQPPKSWLIYFGQTNFMENKLSIHHEFQYRDHKIAGDVNQLLFRVGVKYRPTDYLATMIGYGFIHTESEGVPDYAFMENRVFQQGTLSHSLLQRSRIRHRFRLEQRFVEGQDFSNRFRYCLFADIPFTDKGMGRDGWYAALYDELFINLADNDIMKPFDRNRAYVGIGYKIKDNLGIQLGYMRQHVGKNAGTDHGLLSVHHQINWN